MTERTCLICNRTFSSGNSYRVHKSLFHRNETLRPPQSEVTEEEQMIEPAPLENVTKTIDGSEEKTGAEPQETKVPSRQDTSRGKKGLPWWGVLGLVVIGTFIAPPVLGLLFKKGGGGSI